jgi:hypothetical protein
MTNRQAIDLCGSTCCDYVFIGHILQCVAGTRCDCNRAHFASAKESQFHTKDLREATVAINDILDKLKNSDKSKQLAMLKTPDGFLLAWVGHDGVSSHSHPDKIRAALKLVSE